MRRTRDRADEEDSSISPTTIFLVVGMALFFIVCTGMVMAVIILPSHDPDQLHSQVRSNFAVKKSAAHTLRQHALQQQFREHKAEKARLTALQRQKADQQHKLASESYNKRLVKLQKQSQLLSAHAEALPAEGLPTEPTEPTGLKSIDSTKLVRRFVDGAMRWVVPEVLPPSGPTVPAAVVHRPSSCNCPIINDYDFLGGDIQVEVNMDTKACCHACHEDPDCTRWSLAADLCYLKSDEAVKIYTAGVTSGTVVEGCRPTPQPTIPPSPTPAPPPTMPPSPPPAVVNGPELCASLAGPTGWTCESTAVLVLTYKRANYLTETLDSIFKAHPDPAVRKGSGRGSLFPVFVSQDGDDSAVSRLLVEQGKRLTVIKQRHFNPQEINMEPKEKRKKWIQPYYALSFHYKRALTAMFDLGFRHVIILEEDLPVSIDFFEYFIATGPLLEADPTLFCVSAWNDNGQASHAHDPATLHRTDLFPGLGWMMAASFWDEIAPTWPTTYWDDFVRHPIRRQGRQCIRPEISRTKHIGLKGGASRAVLRGKLGRQIRDVALSTSAVSFTTMDLSFLLSDNYGQRFQQLLAVAKVVHTYELDEYAINPGRLSEESKQYMEIMGTTVPTYPVKMYYANLEQFKSTAKTYGIMGDEKAGVPRTAYKGVVQFKYSAPGHEDKELLVFLAPHSDLYQHCTAAIPCDDSFFKPIPAYVDLSPVEFIPYDHPKSPQ